MTFTCPYCHKQHRLTDDLPLPPNAATHCKKCGRRFVLSKIENELPIPEHLNQELFSEGTTAATLAKETTAILNTLPRLRELSSGKFLLEEIFAPSQKKAYPARITHLMAKLLVVTAPLLTEHILQEDEQVYRIARGIAYFPFEIPYANGLLTGPLNYYALVATNLRLIFINIDYQHTRPSRYVFQVPYDNISRVSRGLYGTSLIITTTTGRRWDFTTVNRTLATNFEKYIQEQSARFPSATEVSHPAQLCPSCYQPVEENLSSCPRCRAQYKHAKVAIKKSLLLPGAGNIYLSYINLGAIEMIGYLLTWMMTTILLIIGIPGGILGGASLVVIYHILAAFMAGNMSKKGYQTVKDETGETTTEDKAEPVLNHGLI